MQKLVAFVLILLLSGCLPAADITIWFGNPDGSPLIFRINSIEYIPVWIHTNNDVYAAAVHIPLATDNRFIIERAGMEVFAPLKSEDIPEGYDPGWDVVSIFDPKPHFGHDGYTNQSLLGFMNLMKNPNVPLHCPDTCKILAYRVRTVDSDSLRGHMLQVMIEGFDERNRGLHFSDTLGVRTFTYEAVISQIYFVYPGDINDDMRIDNEDIEELKFCLDDISKIPWPSMRADVNNDGKIDADDLTCLEQNYINFQHNQDK